METRPLYNTPEAPSIPDTLTIDGQTYRRAGLVVDGLVYLADTDQEDGLGLVGKTGPELVDAPQADIHSLTERILAQLRKQQAGGQSWSATF